MNALDPLRAVLPHGEVVHKPLEALRPGDILIRHVKAKCKSTLMHTARKALANKRGTLLRGFRMEHLNEPDPDEVDVIPVCFSLYETIRSIAKGARIDPRYVYCKARILYHFDGFSASAEAMPRLFERRGELFRVISDK